MALKKVVVIENNLELARSISAVLADKGYKTVCASNGLEGIEKVADESPDLVILNPTVTDLNGSCVYKLLKENPRSADIPILIFLENERDIFRFWGFRPQTEHNNIIKIAPEVPLSETIDSALKTIESRTILDKFQIQNEQFKKALSRMAKVYHEERGFVSSEAKDALCDLLDKLTMILNAELGSLLLLEEDTQELVIKAAKGLSDDIINQTRVKIGRGISGWVAKTASPLLIHNIEKDERFLKENNAKYYTASLISVPIRLDNRVIGVLNINNKASRELFTEYDLSFLVILANEISATMESSFCQRELEKATAQIEKLNSSRGILADVARSLDDELYELTISQEVSNIIYSRLDYKEIVEAILEIIERSIDCQLCGLLFVEKDNKPSIIIDVKYQTTQKEIEAFKSKIVETFNRLTGGRLLPDEVSVNQADTANIIDSFADKRDILSSYQANLLTAGERPIGMLAVTNSFPNAFTDEDIRIFSIISRHSSIAINNTLLHERLKELSVTDGLTGLYVYRFFNEALDKEVLRASRYQQPFSVIMLDLDGFKKINDTFGHLQGDEVLKEIAHILKRICREVDVVSRYGGEEFAVILPETDIDGAFVLADRIRMVIKNYAFGSKDNVINLTASLGVASYPESATSKVELLKQADKALYKAKVDGRNKVCRAAKEIANEI